MADLRVGLGPMHTGPTCAGEGRAEVGPVLGGGGVGDAPDRPLSVCVPWAQDVLGWV